MAQGNSFFTRIILFAFLSGSVGLVFLLMSLGIISSPGTVNGPPWIVFCVGLVFLLAAALLVLRAVAGDPAREGELPPDAPHCLRLVQHLFGLLIFVCMAAIASWIAFGPGERTFTASGSFAGDGGIGETIGRVMFGIGAVIMWLCTLVFAVDAARRLVRRS